MRMPTLFLNHGGGPMPILDPSRQGYGGLELTEFLKSVPSIVGAEPKAIVVVSAHYMDKDAIAITSNKSPELVFDYYGFPRQSYSYKYQAKGDPTLAKQISTMLGSRGIKAKLDSSRGWDHGVFIPLLLAYPDAKYPVVSVSLHASLDPKLHYEVGEALAPLRDEGVLIIASGMSFHNMSAFDLSAGSDRTLKGTDFDEDLRKACEAEDVTIRKEKLVSWESFRGARFCHPQEEHLIPLMVAAGAGGEEKGRIVHSGAFAGSKITSFAFGQTASSM